jgi:hypothetical protein
MILATHGLVQSSGAFDASYQAVLNYATSLGYTLPGTTQRVKQNKLVVDLKAAGIWQKLDTFAVFATDGSSNFALIDWKKLSLYTSVNSPTFTTNGGFTGNSTSSYIDTNFNLSIGTNNYKLNDAGRFAWVDNIGANTQIDGTSTARNIMSASNAVNSIRINQDTTSQNISVNLTGVGFKAGNRIDASSCVIFNNTTRTDTTSVSVIISNANQWLLRQSANYGNSRIRFYAVGSSLVTENTAFYNAVNTYITSL